MSGGEQALLGALMLNGDAFGDVARIVGADDFTGERHRLIFEAMAQLAGERDPLDAVTVCEHLGAAGTLEDAGGIAYLAELIDASPGAASAVRLARQLTDDNQ